jgi:alpha-beta hydrolase superfamily lysophospholipase
MEKILTLAAGSFGLLSLPPGGRSPVAVVLLNAGLIHRNGPFRLYTRMARRLAKSGYAVLRFDLPGIGDAPMTTDMNEQDAIRDALDRTQACIGCKTFVIGGLCSAADSGWKYAMADPRIEGLILLDGIARPGIWHAYARLARLLKRPSRWLGTISRKLHRPPGEHPRVSERDLRDWPEDGAERLQLRAMLSRGVAVLALYTGGASYFLHKRQFRSTFGSTIRHRKVTFEHWPGCDHLFFLEQHRARLIERVESWIRSSFPSATACAALAWLPI